MRRDLPLGSQFAQLLHAAAISSGNNHVEGTYAVALHCKDEEELLQLEQKLKSNQVNFVAIREPDLENQLTAIGVCPTIKEDVRRFVSSFPLIK